MSRPCLILFFLLTCCSAAGAHFGLILPSEPIVEETGTLTLEIKFLHPAAEEYLDMAPPQRFGVRHRGRDNDLLATLKPLTARGDGGDGTYRYWSAAYPVTRPGDHTFFLEPTPYWEAAEDRYIVHYTKVCVAAFGREDSWDRPVGLPTEIVPLTRPYGLWTGNIFSGQVLRDGQPAPFAEIEVEYLNERAVGGKLVAPSAPYATQVVKSDAGGIFHYALPKAGWWGFAALSTADWTLPHEGVEKPVELGAVFWVRARDID